MDRYDYSDYYDGPPIGAHRYPGPDDPELDWSQNLTLDDVRAFAGQVVHVTMTARDDIDPAYRIYDNVKIEKAEPMGSGPFFLVELTQLLIPSNEWGFVAMASQSVTEGFQFGHSLISVTPTDRLYPVRRTYTATEFGRYAGLGGMLTLIRAHPDEPIECGVVLRPVVVDAVEGDTLRLSKVVEIGEEHGRPVPKRTRPFRRPVPLAEVAFAMQQADYL